MPAVVLIHNKSLTQGWITESGNTMMEANSTVDQARKTTN